MTAAAPSPTRLWLGRIGGAALGVVLLVAALAKSLDPTAFAEQIASEGLDLFVGSRALALVALGVEAVLGLLLVTGARRGWVLWPTAVLVAFFLFLTGRAWWRAAHGLLPEGTACGCFGNLVDRTPGEAFLWDIVLLVPPLALSFLGRRTGKPFPRWRTALAVIGAVLVVGFAAVSPTLPLDDLATRLRPGKAVSEICAGGDAEICLDDVVPELQDGETVVVLVDLGRSPESWVDPLNEATWDGEGPPLIALTSASPDEVTAFTWEWGPAFDLREGPAALLRPLYRTLPRSFLVSDGVVTETWSGLPDDSPREE